MMKIKNMNYDYCVLTLCQSYSVIKIIIYLSLAQKAYVTNNDGEWRPFILELFAPAKWVL